MQQTAFLFDSNNAHDWDEYIKSSSNKLAYNAIANWPSHWGVEPYPKTLILEGVKSSGKTFLAKKWATASGAILIKQMHELTESILDHHQAFIIEDFDSNWNEQNILHHFNAIAEKNKYLLITTTKLPEIKLPDLSSRIKASNKIVISLPDDEMMQLLIFKLFSNHSLIVTPEVINYLTKTLPREFPEIVTAIKKINSYALEHKRKITVPLIKQIGLSYQLEGASS